MTPRHQGYRRPRPQALGNDPQLLEVAAIHDLVDLVAEKQFAAEARELPYVGLEHIAPRSAVLDRTGSTEGIVGICNRFGPGDILFGKLRPNLRKCVQADRHGLCSTEVLVLRPRDGHDPRFVAQIVRGEQVFRIAESATEGTKMPRTSWGILSKISLFAPSPDEQRAIADVLDAVDAAIRETEALIVKLKLLRLGLIDDLLTRGIYDNGELRDPVRHPEQFHGAVPISWTCLPLLGATEWHSGGTPSRSKPSWWAGSIPFLTPKDMKRFVLADTIEHLTSMAVTSGSKLMDAETVFIVVRGMILAHTFPICMNMRPIAFNQDIKAVRGLGLLSNRYLAHWFLANADKFLRRVTEATHGTKKLDAAEIARISIAVPQPHEQREIVRRIEQADIQLATLVEEAGKLEAARDGLRDDLLTGRVRVAIAAA